MHKSAQPQVNTTNIQTPLGAQVNIAKLIG
jgi:hypothetical protein